MGRLAELHKQYDGTGVQFLGVVTDVPAWGGSVGDLAAKYIEDTKTGYPNLEFTAALTGNLSYIPSTHIYDGNGNLIAKATGEHTKTQWINMIETVMAKQ